jgi:recombinational DNA repair ATPase RecF
LEYKENKASNNYKKLPAITFVENSKGTRFVQLLMLFGANTSGKTNLIGAMVN